MRLIWVNLPHRCKAIFTSFASSMGTAAVKMTLIVCNSFFTDRLMEILKDNGIDYFTSWDNARGKGRGTQAHRGSGSAPSTTSVTMIAFEDDAPLEALIRSIHAANGEIQRREDHFRLFQLPLEKII